MSLINKDPEKAAEVTPEQIALARKCGYQLAHIVLDDEEGNCCSFIAALPFLPRKDEIIKIEDGKSCKVYGTSFKVGTLKVDGVVVKYLGPNVYARVIPGTGD